MNLSVASRNQTVKNQIFEEPMENMIFEVILLPLVRLELLNITGLSPIQLPIKL
jgi:hypothetical protein